VVLRYSDDVDIAYIQLVERSPGLIYQTDSEEFNAHIIFVDVDLEDKIVGMECLTPQISLVVTLQGPLAL
jgi:uncharacterized protein YuzE